MVSIKHVAEAIVGVVEKGKAGEIYQIGEENLTWVEFLTRLSELTGRKKCVITLPNWMTFIGTWFVMWIFRILGHESGLDPVPFTKLLTAKTFFDSGRSRDALGYGQGELNKALRETVAACGQLQRGKKRR